MCHAKIRQGAAEMVDRGSVGPRLPRATAVRFRYFTRMRYRGKEQRTGDGCRRFGSSQLSQHWYLNAWCHGDRGTFGLFSAGSRFPRKAGRCSRQHAPRICLIGRNRLGAGWAGLRHLPRQRRSIGAVAARSIQAGASLGCGQRYGMTARRGSDLEGWGGWYYEAHAAVLRKVLDELVMGMW